MTRVDLTIKPVREDTSCMGVGLVALDIVDADDESFAAVGGSCGNVMTILAWMGWRTYPVGRLGADWAADSIYRDLEAAGANTIWLKREERIQSPIVIQRVAEDGKGHRSHRFSVTCPECGGWLPRYRPLTLSQASEVTDTGAPTKAFYFDRVSPAALRLARWSRDGGALIVFEPSSIGDERQFRAAVDLCHVLKYSHERLGHVVDLGNARSPRIIIETLGVEGLRMRWRSRWSRIPAFDVPRFRDAAGSGDWCTAGFIHRLGAEGAQVFRTLRKPRLESALRFGQALAAINCGYDGARGAMQAMSRTQMNLALRRLGQSKPVAIHDLQDDLESSMPPPGDLCVSCSSSRRAARTGCKARRA